METIENDILGFDPTQLSVFTNNNDNNSRNENDMLYHPRPVDSKSEDGIYRATIKVIYSPQDLKHSIIEQQSYSIHDKDGWLNVVSSLTIGDKNCPIFKAWKKCRYSDEGSVLYKQQVSKEDGGRGLFDKRFGRYATIQVLKDINHPELENKYMFWKLPKNIYEAIQAKSAPAPEDNRAPIPVMDFLYGRSIKLTVKPGPGKPGDIDYSRQTSYLFEFSDDIVSCKDPMGGKLLDAEQSVILNNYVTRMKEVWNSEDKDERDRILAEISADPNTAKLREIYRDVIAKIKEWCPDLNKEMNYHPWDEATTNRVNNWIKIVLEGNDPAEDAPAIIAGDGSVAAAPVAPTSNVDVVAEPAFASTAMGVEDDLPF